LNHEELTYDLKQKQEWAVNKHGPFL
jgi:hypothetical protein